jgi:NO-binding membrane sensor protein with MHYT domain
MTRIHATFDAATVVLSVGLAFLGSYMTTCFAEQYRQTCLGSESKVLGSIDYFWVMACTLGGVAIWSMHFVGMSSMRLETPDGVEVVIEFALFPTLISLVTVVMFAGAGLYVSSLDDLFGKSKEEIVLISVNQCKAEQRKAMTQRQEKIKEFTNMEFMVIISTYNPNKLLLGGAMAGAGAVVMHYLGM